jgi:serine/threonine protein kinase
VDLIGRTLGLYDVMEVLAAGPEATVYKAYRPTLGLYVAIKVLSEEASQDEATVERFQRSARITAALKHPNIIRIYDVARALGHLYVAMDYVAGPSLEGRLQREGPVPLETAVAVAAQVGSALDFAHNEGVVHGNLTPSNILLAPDGRAIVTDFAVPQPGEAPPERRKRFASPEELAGQAPDARSDIYSLGALLCEMLMGPGSFSGELPRRGLPRRVRGVLSRALHRRKDRRYKSGYDLAQALARAAGLSRSAVSTYLQTAPQLGWAVPLERPPQRRRLLLIGVAAVVLAGAGLAIARGRARPTPSPTPTATAVESVVSFRASPIPTEAPSPTREPSPEPTARPTASREATPTATASATATTPALAVATRPFRVVTATPTLEPAPVLEDPQDGSWHQGSRITFRWHWYRDLKAGEHFDLRVSREGQPHWGIAWTEAPWCETSMLPSGNYRWSVAVIREAGIGPDGTRLWEPVSAESEVWRFGHWVPPVPSVTPTPGAP